MGHSLSDDSESPVRGRGSPRRRSPYRRERSPRHKSSRAARSPVTEKPPSRTRSPKRAKSPISRSPLRDKPSSRPRSPKRAKSPVSRSPMRDKLSSRPRSPKRAKSPVPHSPMREKPSNRARSPKHTRSRSPVARLPVKEKPSSRTRSPVRPKSRSPESRSPSPRSKRLRRAQAESEAEKINGREHERNHGRGGDRPARKEKDLDREVLAERRERMSGRDAVGNGSSKSRNARSTSPSDHHRSRHRSHSPAAANTRARDEMSRGDDHRNDDDDAVAQMKAAEEALETKEKQKPSFELSGKLAAETNRVRGVTLQFNEAPDARKPDIRWRLYVFKGGEVLNEPLYVHRQTHYLFGRERRVADIPTDHPSCSKQHAVLQYRQVEKELPDGSSVKQVKPYIMDLGSTNGTFINENRIEPQRYYELFEKDTLKFGNSSREYVLLHENSA